MRCAWQAYLNLLPSKIRSYVDDIGKDSLLETHLRLGKPPELVTVSGSRYLKDSITSDDLHFVINTACRYSPWASGSLKEGYISGAGGHRIGICGESNEHTMIDPCFLCLRVARDFPGIAHEIASIKGSVLLLGPPGSGKTTMLRDLIRAKSDHMDGSISVIDEKYEIFPKIREGDMFPTGAHTDVMWGCKKAAGIYAVLRNMGPRIIAVDEITAPEDCEALLHAGWCGVDLIATAHAANLDDLYSRPIYKPIVDSKLFDTYVVLDRDKSWRLERKAI